MTIEAVDDDSIEYILVRKADTGEWTIVDTVSIEVGSPHPAQAALKYFHQAHGPSPGVVYVRLGEQ